MVDNLFHMGRVYRIFGLWLGQDTGWDASGMQCITYFKALYHRLNYYEHTRAAILLNAKKQQQELSELTTVIPLEWQQSCVKNSTL